MKIQQISSCNPEKWVEKYADDLFAWAFQRTGNRAVAEDLVQETFLTALAGIENLNSENSEKTWLYSILRIKVIGYFHEVLLKFKTTEGLFDDEDQTRQFRRLFFDESGKWKKAQKPVNWHSEDEDLPNDGEFMSILKMCLKLLPEQSRGAVTLRFMDERNTSEICADLDITPSELWATLQRAKLQLRGCIEENWLND